MKVTIVVPARFGSSRLQGKPMRIISGRPLIQHVVSRLSGAAVSAIIVATDNDEIRQTVEGQGIARVVMTSSEHECGTDRIAEVARNLDSDLILNVQGDQLVPDSKFIDELLRGALEKSDIATCYTNLTDPHDLNDTNVVKVVVNQLGNIIYMSRCPIPYDRGQYCRDVQYYKQVGVYLFRRESLLRFSSLKPAALELTEGVELLRVLDSGQELSGIYTNRPLADVDVEEDIEKAETYILQYPLAG